MSLGKNSAFLNSFWDLASNESDIRIAAAGQIIDHVKGPEGGQVETEYAVKRLVRGLGSSRESARQGFVTCLSQLLAAVPSIAIGETLILIDDNTKITGAMKGSEERDLMFGKLFGYLSLIRSGKIGKDQESVLMIFDRLLELHNRKGWIREVVCESILTLLNAVHNDIMPALIPKLKVLLGNGLVAIADMTAWQLMLCVGIQQLANAAGAGPIKSDMLDMLPQIDIATPASFQDMVPTLIEATAGFPKIHRVWDFIMSSIFPMDASRALPKRRPVALTSKQEDMLNTFCGFIDKHLLPSSVEKRSVALKLSIELVRLSPAELIPIACSRSLVKCIFACRVNRKHVLYSLAGSVLLDLTSSVGTNTPCRLALASCLVQYGGANFDAVTGTRAVSTLLEGLGSLEVASHVRFLCGVLGASLAVSSSSNTAESQGAAGTEDSEMEMEVEVDGMDDPVASANGAIEALCSLVRNTRINNRAYVCAATIAVFVRLSCFRDGHTKGMAHKDANPQVGKKKTKKNEAQIDDMPTLDGLNAEIIDVIQLVEGTTGGSNNNNSSSGSSSSGSGAFHVSTEIAELAGAKLMAILADIGNQTLTQLNTPNPAVLTAEEREKEKGARRKKDNESLASEGHHSTLLLDVAIAAVDYLSTLGGLELVRSEEEAEEEEDYSLVMTAFTSALTSMKELAPAAVPSLSLLTDPALALAILSGAGTSNGQKVKTIVAAVDVDATDSDASISNSNSNSNSSTEGVDKLRLRESLYQLLGHAVFHCLTSSVVSLESLKDMADVSVRIVAEVNGEEAVTDAKRHKHSDDDEDDDEDEDEDERPQSILFDASMEMLSVSGDHAVKGVRDAIKRAWNALCQVCAVDEDVVEAALAAVVADDGEEEANPVEKKAGGKTKGEKRKRDDPENDEVGDEEDEADDDEEEDEEEDEVLSGEQAFDFLSTDFGMEDGEDEDEDGLSAKAMHHMALQHSEEADGALVQLLSLRRQSRKRGLMEAQRNQLLIRTRAIDILEILVHRAESSTILLPLFLPLLRTLKKLQGAATSQSMQEGRAFEQRLRIIIEQKLCKKKFQLIADSDDVSVVPAAAVAVIATTADAEVKKVKKTKKMVEEEQRKKEEEDERALEEVELRKASSSEMRQEVTTLTAEIFKGLTSAVAPLRPVALSALLCITRAAVSTPNTDAQCRAVMSSSLQAAFVDFSTKKNCRLNPKIFDELIQRFPDFCISSFLVHLIPSCENAKSSFLRAECCRFLGEILKRHKSLQKSSLEVLSSSLKSIVTTLGGALTFNFSSPSIIEAEGSTGTNIKKEEKNKIKAAAAMLTVPSEDKDSSTRGASSKEISAEKEKETRAKRLKPLLMCTKELAGLFKSQSLSQSLGNKDQEDALKALIAVMQSESISGSTTSSPAVVRLVEQVLQILKTVGAASSVSSKAEGVKGKEMKPLNTAVSVVENKSNIKRKDEKKEAKKLKREVSEDKMVLSANEREQEESDDALPVGEYVEVGAKGPNFKKKKGGKKEAKEDQQEILDVAEKKLVKKMHEEKRKRAENEDVERDGVVEVEKKRKWHE